MTERWCPNCRVEWWIDVELCPDCDATLVAEPPPEDPEEDVDHDLAEIELDDLSPSDRWELGMHLRAERVTFTWRDTTLLLPAADQGLVEQFLDTRPDPDEVAARIAAVLGTTAQLEADADPVPSPRFRRLGAYVIDWMLLVTCITPIGLFWSTTTHRPHLTVTRATPGAVWTSAALVAVYSIVGVAVFGRTVGKHVFGLRVTRPDGEPAGWVSAVVRAVVGWGLIVAPIGILLPSWTRWVLDAWPIVVFGPILFDPARRGLHDRLAGTVVTHHTSNSIWARPTPR